MNMAIDERALEYAVENQAIVIRIYTWSEPTLSLGYFQKFEDRSEHEASNQLAVVRRKTGGGAIIHEHEWTYSIAVPASFLTPHSTGGLAPVGAAQELYDCVHNAIVAWLGELSIVARCWKSQNCGTKPDKCAFLCFDRRSEGDVVIDLGDQNFKVLGSAQRRVQGGMLQHGSLLLRHPNSAPHLKGLEDLGVQNIAQRHESLTVQGSSVNNPAPNPREFLQRVCMGLSDLGSLTIREPTEPPDFFRGEAGIYSSDRWTLRV